MTRTAGWRLHRLGGLILVGALTVPGVPGVSTASAATEIYSVDAGHSSVAFSITHFFSRVTGRFTRFEGTIVFDPDEPETGSVQVVIDAGSIDTDNAERDRHLRSADFFDVANHPRITFESSAVRLESDGSMLLDGSLTLLGVSRPVTLETTFLGSGPDLWGGYRCGFESRTTINRKDFGMTWNEVLDNGGLMLGDEVSIRIDIEGLRMESTPEESPPAEDGAPPDDEDPGAEEVEPEPAEPAQQ